MNFRKIELKTGTKILLGKNESQNEELVNQFKGKVNTILHTAKPGSPFGIIEKEKPTKEEVYLSGTCVSRFSQDWRDNKTDVKVHVFTGKDVYKRKGMKVGTFGVKKYKELKVNKEDIEKCQQ